MPHSTDLPAHDLLDLSTLHPTLRLDVRYARADNFFGRAVYSQAKAFLQAPVARDLLRAHAALAREGYGLLVFDGYRPWSVTKLFYEGSDATTRRFLANPETGSTHNRGCAVDLSLYSLASGVEAELPSGFDEMNEKAYADYPGGSAETRKRRDLLIEAMHAEGFRVLKNEWWHFNHPAAADYPILDLSFEQVLETLRRNG